MRVRLGALVVLAGCGGGLPQGLDSTLIDKTTDPCDDFYQYACGAWLKRTKVPTDGAAVSRRATASYNMQKDEDTLLDEMMSASAMTTEAKLLRGYQQACLDAASSTDRRELNRLVGAVDSMDAGFAGTVALLHQAGVRALFSFGSGRDVMAPMSVVAQLREGGIGLPDRTYYVDSPATEALGPYGDHVTALAQQVQLYDVNMRGDVIAIETTLATGMLDSAARRDPRAVHHVRTLAEVKAQVPHFDWDAYLAASGAPAFTTLDETQPAFFDALERVLAQVPADQLKRYLKWRIIESQGPLLDDGVIAREVDFHGKVFSGQTTPLPRKDYCQRLTVDVLEWSMSKLYMDRYGAGLADKVTPMFEKIRGALKGDLDRASWLDEPTRAEAQAKADAMRAGLAAPADFSPYLPAPTELSTNLALATTQLDFAWRAQALARIGGTDTREWFMAPVEVNAAYSWGVNAINMPVGILRPPFYSSAYSDPVNYGALGSIIGHEVTHGFDDQGRQFDRDGALRDFWSASTASEFQSRASCVVDQYAALDLDGQLTLGENIADLGGVKLSFAALDPQTDDDSQAFFLSYAQQWCTVYRPEYLATLKQLDPHAPASARVNAVLADTPEFATAFSCSEGQPMAPVKRCGVW